MPGRWPQGTLLTWCLDPSNLAPEVAAALIGPIGEGVESWDLVCGVRHRRVDDPSQARHVFVIETIDTSGVELGLTQEPVGATAETQLVTRINTVALGGWTGPKVRKVAVHETGHSLGLGHSPDGVRSCMSATLDETVDSQQPWEIGQAQGLYGPPLTPSSNPGPFMNPLTAVVTTVFASSVSKVAAAVVAPLLLRAIATVPPDQVVSFVLGHADVAALPVDEQADAAEIVHGLVSFAEHFAAHRISGR